MVGKSQSVKLDWMCVSETCLQLTESAAESSAALQTQLLFARHVFSQARGKSLWKKELKSCAHSLSHVCCSCCKDPLLEAPAWKNNQ